MEKETKKKTKGAEEMKTNLNIDRGMITGLFLIITTGFFGFSVVGETKYNMLFFLYLIGLLLIFAIETELPLPIIINFGIENKCNTLYEKILIISECWFNLLRAGTNAGRLTDHLDTEFYRNRIRRVH